MNYPLKAQESYENWISATIPQDCICHWIPAEALDILERVGDRLHLTTDYICGGGRQTKRSYAKALFAFIAENETDLSQHEIGEAVGVSQGRVWQMIKLIKDFLDVDQTTKDDIAALMGKERRAA